MNLGLIFTGAGYLVGAVVFWWGTRRSGFSKEVAAVLMISGFVAGIVGAKVVQALMQGVPGVALDPAAGGRAVFGGLIAGWIAVEIVKRRLGVNRSTGDAFAFALAAGECVGRVGCFFNGCCFGSASNVPWAVHQHGEMRHPAQIYSSIVAGLLFGLLLLAKKKAPYDGALFHVYLAAWGASRFSLEFFRDREGLVFGLDLMQIAALETLLFGAAALTLASLKRKHHDPTP